jgi:hypothetical protein
VSRVLPYFYTVMLCALCQYQWWVPIFPSKEELKTPPDNGVFVTQLSYSIAMSRMNKIAKQVLGLVNYKVGMHTLCYTGYVYGKWGGGTIELLAKSA